MSIPNEIEIIGIVCTGNDARRRALQAKKILNFHPGFQNVGVWVGCSEPICRAFSAFNQYFDDNGVLEDGDEENLKLEEGEGCDAIFELCRIHENVEILAIGPMTTVAQALIKHPELKTMIRKLYIMGGYWTNETFIYNNDVPVTLPFSGDYNLTCDPAASLVVLQSGIPTVLVPPQLTLQTWFTKEDLQSFIDKQNSFSTMLVNTIRFWQVLQKKWLRTDDDNMAFLHDPLTLYAMTHNPKILKFERKKLSFNIQGVRLFRVFEINESNIPLPSSDLVFEMDVGVHVDVQAFRDYLREKLLSL